MCNFLLEILALAIALDCIDALFLSTSSSAFPTAEDTTATRFIKIKRDESGCLALQPPSPDVKRDLDDSFCPECVNLSGENNFLNPIQTDSAIGVNLGSGRQDFGDIIATSIPDLGGETPDVFSNFQDGLYQAGNNVGRPEMPCTSPYGPQVYAVLLLQMAVGDIPEEAQHQSVIVTQLLFQHDVRYDVVIPEPGRQQMRYRKTDPYDWTNPKTGHPIDWSRLVLRGWIVPPSRKIDVFAAVDAIAKQAYLPYYPDTHGEDCRSWANEVIGSLKTLGYFHPFGSC